MHLLSEGFLGSRCETSPGDRHLSAMSLTRHSCLLDLAFQEFHTSSVEHCYDLSLPSGYDNSSETDPSGKDIG